MKHMAHTFARYFPPTADEPDADIAIFAPLESDIDGSVGSQVESQVSLISDCTTVALSLEAEDVQYSDLYLSSFPSVLFSPLLRCASVDQVRSLTEKCAGFVETTTHVVCVLTRFCGVFCSLWCCIIFKDDTAF